jgi:uncharacterized protein with von Willebrand factor type A (vWA) domain
MCGGGPARGIFASTLSRDRELGALCSRGTTVYRPFTPLLTDVFTFFYDGSAALDSRNESGCDRLHYLVLKYLSETPEYASLRRRSAGRIQESLAAMEEFGSRLLEHLGNQSSTRAAASQAGTDGGDPVEIESIVLAEVAKAGSGSAAGQAVLVLAKNVEGAIETTGLLADICNSFGLSPGQIRAMPLAQRAGLAARMGRSANLKRFAELLGRWSILATSTRAKRTPGVPEELSDVTYGDDWALFVPQELGALIHPALRYDFYSRLIERKVLQYDPQSTEGQGKGPILICLDTSGSMAGDRDVAAKAAAIALYAVARKEERPFAVILFSSPDEWLSFVFRKESVLERASTGEETRCGILEAYLKVATFFFGGGTDYESPLKEAYRLIEEGGSEWRDGDIVFITDDYCDISEEFRTAFKAAKMRLSFNVFSVIVGTEADNARTLLKFSDRVLAAGAFGEETAAQVFSAV